MRSFTDKTGRKWDIDLPWGVVDAIKKANPAFNLLNHELAEKLWEDEGEFFELLWLLVEDQAIAAGINAKDFGKAIAAKCLFDAKRAFFDEWRDFFLELQRPDKAMALEKLAELQTVALEAWEAQKNAPVLKEFSSRARQHVSTRLSKAFGDLEGLLDSIPDSSPGGNSGT